MKKIYGVSLLMGMLAAPQIFALTLQLPNNPNGYGPYQTGSGGEFDFGISDGTLITSGYITGSGGTANQALGTISGYSASFETFCVEGAETISAGGKYTATYNNHSVLTGTFLTKGAAYLYSQFATEGNFGGSASYNFGGTAAQRQASANDFQRAIWLLMGGQEGLTVGNIGVNAFLTAAENAFGGTFAGANTVATTGYDNVYVLNLLDSDGRNAQDQLIYTPGPIPNVIPDGGMTAMLLGVAFTGLAFVRRIRR